MAKKKSFRADDIAEQFLSSSTEETAPISATETTTADQQQQGKPAKRKPAKTPERQDNAQGTLFEIPMKPDYRYVETKSKRLNLLVQPSIYAKIKAAADQRGESVNELIHSLLEAFEG